MKRQWTIAIVVHKVSEITILSAYGLGLLSTLSGDNPAGSTGLFAPIVALSTAMIVVVQKKITSDTNVFILPERAIAIGSIFTAHLWLSDASGYAPFSIQLIGIVFVVALVGLASTALQYAGDWLEVVVGHIRKCRKGGDQ